MGEGVLVDTDVLIDFVRGSVELPEEPLYISEITLYEFVRGSRDISRAKAMLEEGFSVLFHDNPVILKASEIWVKLRKEGVTLDDRDILIGAVSAVKGLPLMTRNTKHYERLKPYGTILYQQ